MVYVLSAYVGIHAPTEISVLKHPVVLVLDLLCALTAGLNSGVEKSRQSKQKSRPTMRRRDSIPAAMKTKDKQTQKNGREMDRQIDRSTASYLLPSLDIASLTVCRLVDFSCNSSWAEPFLCCPIYCIARYHTVVRQYQPYVCNFRKSKKVQDKN